MNISWKVLAVAVSLSLCGAGGGRAAEAPCADDTLRTTLEERLAAIETRGSLGVSLHMDSTSAGIDGMTIAQVRAGSAAEAADLRPDDYIVRFAGRDLRGATVEAIDRLIESLRVGQTVEITIIRNDERLVRTVVAGPMTPPAISEALGVEVLQLLRPGDDGTPRFYGDVPEEIRRQVEGEKH